MVTNLLPLRFKKQILRLSKQIFDEKKMYLTVYVWVIELILTRLGGKAGGDFKADVKRGNESPGWAILTHGRNKDQNIEQ